MRFGLLTSIITVAVLAGAFAWVCAEEGPGLKLNVEPIKQIFSTREGLVFKYTFTAQRKVKLCLSKDLLSQIQVDISHSGRGKMPLQPLVIQDNSQIYQEPMRVLWLENGQSVTLRANLKRYQFSNGEKWTPGEYSVNTTFNLCEQTPAETVTDPGKEIPIHASQQGWFMIMI
jgi:hypothetical protein